mmetsp:Transcript_8725/g.21740  ORF Transcript_8725/g.21740 Transcript_8725/m.21740 type:complete len:96 (-) Transcript_8725:835-1122(-)
MTLAWMGANVSQAPKREQNQDGTLCGICLRPDYVPPVVMLACGHLFCFSCLSSYYHFLRVSMSGAGASASRCRSCRLWRIFYRLSELDSWCKVET